LQVKNGDITALERLYGLTYNHIYFIIYQMVKCREDAQDILQDTYIRAFSKIQTLKEPASFYSWIIKIAVNLSKNHIKHNKTIIIENETDAFYDSIISDNGENITERIENTETREILLKLLDMLPEEQKRAVLLYYYENMTTSEIAEIEETTVSTITSRLSYARDSLRKAITAYEKKHNMKLHGFQRRRGILQNLRGRREPRRKNVC
jgi:RNA polymerase sigma factor (sigma-70 family)